MSQCASLSQNNLITIFSLEQCDGSTLNKLVNRRSVQLTDEKKQKRINHAQWTKSHRQSPLAPRIILRHSFLVKHFNIWQQWFDRYGYCKRRIFLRPQLCFQILHKAPQDSLYKNKNPHPIRLLNETIILRSMY